MASKMLAFVLSVALVFVGTTSMANASLISTQQAVATETRAELETEVRAPLARADVAKAMVEMGVNLKDVDARVAARRGLALAPDRGFAREENRAIQWLRIR